MRRAIVLSASLLFFVLAANPAFATLQSGRADAELGQVDFSGAQCGSGARALCAPSRVAIAPSGRLYVSDTTNNRVLSWRSAQRFSNGQPADIVLGQPDFTTNANPTCSTTPSIVPSSRSLCQPMGLAVDHFGRLYVADALDNRVLRFSHVATGQAADLVLGQPDFSSRLNSTCAGPGAVPSPSSFCGPAGVAVDPFGRLWVADAFNDRVLRFDWIRASGQAADLVLGQPSMTSRGCNGTSEQTFGHLLTAAATAGGMCLPIDVTVDRFGRLYVTDMTNSRVLRFDLPRTNGEPATLALGQPDLTSAGCDNYSAAASASSFCEPAGVAVDNWGRVYVADRLNSRILQFDRPHHSGESASVVLGQSDMTSRQCNRSVAWPAVAPTADGVCGPQGVAVDAARHLYVADSRNNRVLRFN